MKALTLVAALSLAPAAQDAESEVRAAVEHFLTLLGELRFYALEQYLTDDATITTARSTTSGFVNTVVSGDEWLKRLMDGPAPQPFREVLTNVDIEVASGEIASVRADFEVVRDTGTASSGVNFFALVKRGGAWKIASITFTSIPSAPGASLNPLELRLQAMLDALPAKSSMYAKHLPSGREVAVRADQSMNTLSVIKIPIMVQAFLDAEAGKLDLDARYEIKPEERRRGSGLLQTFTPVLEPTFRDLVTHMIITSDNTATDIMIGHVGLERVNALLETHEYDGTRLMATTGDLFRRVWEMKDPAHASMSHAEVFEQGFPDDEGASERTFAFEGDPDEWLGRTTAREMTRLLEQIVEAEIASRESSDEMIAILKRQLYTSRLPRYIRFDVSVAHKTGDWPPVAGNDVGILFHDGGPTVVSVFVNQNTGDFDAVESTIGAIARELIEAWSK